MASEIPTHMLNPLDIEVLDLKFIKKLGALVIGGLLVGKNNIPCTNIVTFLRFIFIILKRLFKLKRHKKVVCSI